MSEQVGAGLVLAQMLLPTQSSPTDQSGRLPGLSADPANSLQAVDSFEENPAAFASLLTELENLQIRAPVGTETDLIRVRVATEAPATARPAADANPETGNGQLETGNRMPVAGNLPPLLEVTPEQIGLRADPSPPAAEQLRSPEIIVREPGPAVRTPTTAQPATTPLPDQLPVQNQSAGTASPQTTGAGLPPPTPTLSPAPNSAADSQVRSSEPVTTPVSASMTTDTGTGTAGESNTGQRQGEGERQAQATLSSRGPSITFSTEGLPSATLTSAQASPGPLSTTVPTTLSQTLTLLGQPGQWAEPLAERLASLAAGNLNTRGVNTAEIRLHPPSLGQLEVRISISNDQASLIVASANPEVREALQQAMPRLDSLLNGLGIELAESEVTERQADDFQASAEGSESDNGVEDAGTGESAPEQSQTLGLSLLDTWA